MTSIRQFKTNRGNATKSSGPKTAAGKNRSRMNALRHGLTATTLIIPGEHPDDFDSLRAALEEQFQPRSPLAAELVERLAATLWRLRRVPPFEAAVLAARENQCRQLGRIGERPEGDASLDLAAVGEALIHDSQFGDTLRKLGRHEMTLMNAFDKTRRTLANLQLDEQVDEAHALRAA